MHGWLWACQLRVGRNIARTMSRGRGGQSGLNVAQTKHTANSGERGKVGGVEDERSRLLRVVTKQT